MLALVLFLAAPALGWPCEPARETSRESAPEEGYRDLSDRALRANVPAPPDGTYTVSRLGDETWAFGRGLWQLTDDGWIAHEAPNRRLRDGAWAFGARWLLDDTGAIWREDGSDFRKAHQLKREPTQVEAWHQPGGDTDAGWVKGPLERRQFYSELIVVGENLWALSMTGHAFRTTDGKTWQAAHIPAYVEVNGFTAHKGALYAWGDRALYRHREAQGWEKLSAPDPVRTIWFSDDAPPIFQTQTRFMVNVDPQGGFTCGGEALPPSLTVAKGRLWADSRALYVHASHQTQQSVLLRVDPEGERPLVVFPPVSFRLAMDAARQRFAWSDDRHTWQLDLSGTNGPVKLPYATLLGFVNGELWVEHEDGAGTVDSSGEYTKRWKGRAREVFGDDSGVVWFLTQGAELVAWDGKVRLKRKGVRDVVSDYGRIAWKERQGERRVLYSSALGVPEAGLETGTGGWLPRILSDGRLVSRKALPGALAWVDGQARVVERTPSAMALDVAATAPRLLLRSRQGSVFEPTLERFDPPRPIKELRPPAATPAKSPPSVLPTTPRSVKRVAQTPDGPVAMDVSGWLWRWSGRWTRLSEDRQSGDTLVFEEGALAIYKGTRRYTLVGSTITEVDRDAAGLRALGARWRIRRRRLQRNGSDVVVPGINIPTHLFVDEANVWVMGTDQRVARFDGKAWHELRSEPRLPSYATYQLANGALFASSDDVLIRMAPDGSQMGVATQGRVGVGEVDGEVMLYSPSGVVPLPKLVAPDRGELRFAAKRLASLAVVDGAVFAVGAHQIRGPVVVLRHGSNGLTESPPLHPEWNDFGTVGAVGEAGVLVTTRPAHAALYDPEEGATEIRVPSGTYDQMIAVGSNDFAATMRGQIWLFEGEENRLVVKANQPILIGSDGVWLWYTESLGDGRTDPRSLKRVRVDGGAGVTPVVVAERIFTPAMPGYGFSTHLRWAPTQAGDRRITWWSPDMHLMSAKLDGADLRDHGERPVGWVVVVGDEVLHAAGDVDQFLPDTLDWVDDAGEIRFQTRHGRGYRDVRIIDGRWFGVCPTRVAELVPKAL